jgi:hypothetical protein
VWSAVGDQVGGLPVYPPGMQVRRCCHRARTAPSRRYQPPLRPAGCPDRSHSVAPSPRSCARRRTRACSTNQYHPSSRPAPAARRCRPHARSASSRPPPRSRAPRDTSARAVAGTARTPGSQRAGSTAAGGSSSPQGTPLAPPRRPWPAPCPASHPTAPTRRTCPRTGCSEADAAARQGATARQPHAGSAAAPP